MSVTRLTRDRVRDGALAGGAGAGRHGVLGLGLALFSAATFGTSGTFASSLMSTGWTPGAVVTFRIVLAALLLTGPGVLALRGKWHLLRGAIPSVLAFGLVAVGGCQLFYFNAVQRLDVGVALLLEYSGILLIVLYLWFRRGHRPRRLTVVGGLAALAGLLLVLQPGGGRMDPIGVFWGLLAATGLAVYFVLSSNVDDALPPIALAWAAMVVGALTLTVLDLVHVLPFRVETTDVVLLDRRMSWVIPVVGLSLVAAAIAYASGILAARMLGAKLASFVGLTEVLFGVLIAWLLLGQAPDGLQLLGGLVVLVGIALVRADGSGLPAAVAEPVLVQP
jgi:drug/metabolite transporter (DMT)-like permease